MLISHEREKLLNAIIFFAKNSSYLGKIKLWKLLYFLDFEHFKETGRSVTGMRYNAWPMGPVPVSLHNEVEAPGADMAEKIRFGSKVVNGSNSMLTVTPLTEFDVDFIVYSIPRLRVFKKSTRFSPLPDPYNAVFAFAPGFFLM